MTPFLVVLFLSALGAGIVALAIRLIDAWGRERPKAPRPAAAVSTTVAQIQAQIQAQSPPVAAPARTEMAADPFAHVDAGLTEPRR